jgi:hypothetical protein
LDRAIEWKSRGWQALLLAALLLNASGCGSSTSPTSEKQLAVAPAPAPRPDVNRTDQSAQELVGQFLQSLNSGEANSDLFTLNFKKRIAKPQLNNEDDAALGYNKDKFDVFLKKINVEPGSPNKYKEEFAFVDATEGPYALGEFRPKTGRPEGYLIHLVAAEAPSGWQIDWFQRSPVFIPYVEKLKPEVAGAELAVHRFMENLLGGELLLAEATLSQSWKVKKYWSVTKSDADLGYNPSLVQRQLTEWRSTYPEYGITSRDFAAGKPPVFEVIALDAQMNPQKIFGLTVKKEASGEWVVDDVVVDGVEAK